MTDYELETLLAYKDGIVAAIHWNSYVTPIAKRLQCIKKLLDERYLHNPQNQFVVEPWGEHMILTKKARNELGLDKKESTETQREMF